MDDDVTARRTNRAVLEAAGFEVTAADTISVGSMVVWVNADGVAHTSTASAVPASASSWDKAIGAGGRDSLSFAVTGTYQYYCKIHGSPGAGMHGTIVVR